MKYQDPQSLLVVVVKKENGKGGDIIVNGNVTNLVGTYIADGSILHKEHTPKHNQLLIYGSIFTNNTIGGSVNRTACPFGVSPCDTDAAKKYDLVRLREFTVIPSKFITNNTCHTFNDDLVPTEGNTTKATEYAWAGKKKCRNSESTTSSFM